MAVIHHRPAVRNVIGAAKGYASTHEVRPPRSEAPAEAGIYAQSDSHAKADSDSYHHADRNRRHYKARVGHYHRSEDDPRIVIRNGHQKRIDRSN
jgi:hypothetical protein